MEMLHESIVWSEETFSTTGAVMICMISHALAHMDLIVQTAWNIFYALWSYQGVNWIVMLLQCDDIRFGLFKVLQSDVRLPGGPPTPTDLCQIKKNNLNQSLFI